MKCAFTGYLPEIFELKDEDSPKEQAFRYKMMDIVIEIHHNGYKTFLSGMKRGCDEWLAETVLYLQKYYRDIYIDCILPYSHFTGKRSKLEMEQYNHILSFCNNIYTVSHVTQKLTKYTSMKIIIMHCAYLISNSHMLYAVYDHDCEPQNLIVKYMVQTALKKHMPVILMHPHTMEIGYYNMPERWYTHGKRKFSCEADSHEVGKDDF